MKASLLSAIVLPLALAPLFAANTRFDGEFADKALLNGQGVIQLSLQQQGEVVSVAFDVSYKDGRDPAPEGTGEGKVSGQNVKFSWKDSDGNAGTGTLTLAGNDALTVSFKTTAIRDKRCLVFYRENMRLKRVARR